MSKEPESEKFSLWRWQVHPPVFWGAAGLIAFFVILSLASLENISAIFQQLQSTIATSARWFLISAVNIFLLFVVWLMFSRYRKIRLGGAQAKPEFSYQAWLAMLFSAGMGIGLLFYSVAEPVLHYASPPYQPAVANAASNAQQAMALTFFHWGLHAWGIYALVGLALAFFCFNRGLPLTIRSIFHPLLKERIHGPVGYAIDILAVLATLFGVATSLGLGVQQVNAGLSFVFGWPQNITVQILLIAGITAMATTSVVWGLDKGIRRLSELNMMMAGLLLLFVLIFGPTLFILNGLVQNIGFYIQKFVSLSTWTETYSTQHWQENWTVFYWSWWVAWSPFVGMFIARISKGRTIREFLVGVLLVPTLLTFLWLTIFGNSALFEELHGVGGLAKIVQDNVPIALFELLNRYPFAIGSSLLGVVVVILFFVTSSDSGSLVIDIITSGGNPDPPVLQRIFWSVTEGTVAAVLLLGGGLKALQAASITTGLPFAVVLLFAGWSLLKGLKQSYNENDASPLFQEKKNPSPGGSQPI